MPTTERFIDISAAPIRLSFKNGLLVFGGVEAGENTIPVKDIGALVVSNPMVTFTHAAIAALASENVPLIVCDEKHLPCGMLLPLASNSVQTERLALQAAAPLPVKKSLWKQVVKAKIKAQGNLLKELHGGDFGLLSMAENVKSGDSGNLEAAAARRYWSALFSDEDFIRDRFGDDQNRHLNYGYAVLRAIVARGICAAGLHPSIGIHHHNRYDAFCLADDMMEPFRTIVDRAVYMILKEFGSGCALDRGSKQTIIESLNGKFDVNGEERTLFDISARLGSSLFAAFSGEKVRLQFPAI